MYNKTQQEVIKMTNKYFSRIATALMATAMFIGIYACCDINDENQGSKTYSKSKHLDLDNSDPKERCIKIKGTYKDGTCYGHFKYSWKDGFTPFAETYFGACKDVNITTDGDSARFEGVCGKKGTKVVISSDHAAKTCAEKCPKCPEVTLTDRGDCLHTTNENARKDICLNNYIGAKYDDGFCHVQIKTPIDIKKAQSIFDDKFGGCSTYGLSAPNHDGYATWLGICGTPFINMNVKFKVKESQR